MKKNVVTVFILMILIMEIFSNVVLADKATVGKTNATTVRLRKEANTSCDTLKLLGLNSKVDVYGEEGDWYQVGYDGIVGYISKQFIDIVEEGEFVPGSGSQTSTQTTPEQPTQEPEKPTSETTPAQEEPAQTPEEPTSNPEPKPENPSNEMPNGENTTVSLETEEPKEFNLEKETDLRNVPSFGSKVVTSIANGTNVKIEARLGNWVKVTDGNVTGWIIKLRTTKPSEQTNSGEQNPPAVSTDDNQSSRDNNTSTPNTGDITASDFPKNGTVSEDGSRLRASKDGRVYILLDINAKLEVIGEDDTWYIVNYGEYKNAYIAKSLVKLD